MAEKALETRTTETDVLIVGGGGAGFRAAIGAKEKGASAILVSKGALARSGASPMAGADLTAHGQGMRAAGFFGEPRDSEQKFFSDIVHHGSFLNDQKLTEIYVRDGPDRLLEMVDWGIKVNFTDERAVFTPGTSIMGALHRQARKVGVDLVEDMAILDLLLQDGKVVGVLGLDLYAGEFVTFKSKAVVLATGGWHQAYTPVTGSRELTGDGVAMAYRAGAELTDMEFVTFCCNVLYWPPVYRGSIFTYILGMLYGGVLENGEGERIFDKYDPDMVAYANRTEWNKSFISYITAKEIRAGKSSPHGGVYLRLGDIPWAAFEAGVNQFYPGWKFHGADFPEVGRKLKSGEGVEVGPGAEYFEGGVAVNERYETNVPGLYAAGECASSVFGANRVAAATMEMLVAGAIAGWSAGEYVNATKTPEVDGGQVRELQERAMQPLGREGGVKPSDLRKRLQVTSQEKLGPIRNESELEEYLAFLDEIKRNDLPALYTSSKSRRYNKEWIEALDLASMIQVQELTARAALARTESRGVHYREDCPNTDNDQWLKELAIKLEGGEMQIGTRPVNITTMPPPKGVTPYLEFIHRMMKAHSDVGGHH